ncbi:WD40 repeat domain-containing protein [Gayadomonas joobiniege]|uniref:WD40 repeat domain-containing protein n=1 Tax=Gayadomonas joobiniege TaxID=1234606 RepID=UPI0009DACB85|nr:hypothetical protein [Gayadomonas joobiniege]
METTPANYIRYTLSCLLAAATLACQPAPEAIVKQTPDGAFAGDLSAMGELSAMSTQTGVTLWDRRSATNKFLWSHKPGYQNRVHCVSLSDNNQTALTTTDNEFALWNMQTGANQAYFNIEEDLITDCAVADSGQQLVLGMLSGQLLVVTPKTGRRLYFLGHTERISRVAISANGDYILSGSYDGSAYLWRSQDAQIVYDFSLQGRITQISLDRLGRYAFTANSTNHSQIWDLRTGEALSRLNYFARQQIFSAVTFSHNGRWLATGAPGQKIKIWAVETGELIFTSAFMADSFSAAALDLAFSADDQTLYVAISSGKIQTIKLALPTQP